MIPTKQFLEWAHSKDFYNPMTVYPYTNYVSQEMQIAWIAYQDGYEQAKKELNYDI